VATATQLFGGGPSAASDERAQCRGVLVADSARHSADAEVGGAQQVDRVFEAYLLDIVDWRHAERARGQALQRALADPDVTGEQADLQGAGEPVADCTIERGQDWVGDRQQGTILFVNGGSAVKPGRNVTGTSVAFAGQAAYAQVLNEVLGEEDIQVSQLIIGGQITPGDKQKDPDVLAQHLWELHSDRGEFRRQISAD